MVAGYLANVLALLKAHHDGEEEVLFSRLIERCPEGRSTVDRAARQHEEVLILLDNLLGSVGSWTLIGELHWRQPSALPRADPRELHPAPAGHDARAHASPGQGDVGDDRREVLQRADHPDQAAGVGAASASCQAAAPVIAGSAGDRVRRGAIGCAAGCDARRRSDVRELPVLRDDEPAYAVVAPGVGVDVASCAEVRQPSAPTPNSAAPSTSKPWRVQASPSEELHPPIRAVCSWCGRYRWPSVCT